MPVRSIDDFVPSHLSSVTTTAHMSHTVARGTLRGEPGRLWIRKEMESPSVALRELLAQEFFRLIIPEQPETRLAEDPILHTPYILSEEVPGYKNLPLYYAEGFANGTYTGLGQVMLTSVFVQEIDLKNGNLGLDHLNRVIKIDGDWSFAQTRESDIGVHAYGITSETIASLPYPVGFYAFNWLDLFKNNVAHVDSDIVNPLLSKAPQFRAEVNQAMLNICLLPDSFIDKFVDAYMPAGGERYASLIKERRTTLQLSAMNDPSFKAYLTTPQAIRDTESLLAHMMAFKVDGVPLVPAAEHASLPVEIRTKAGNLAGPLLVAENKALLREIYTYRISDQDYTMKAFIAEQNERIRNNSGNPAELLLIKKDLENALTAVESPEVAAVKIEIVGLRAGVTRYTIGKNDKADKIERALYATPIHERKNVVTHEGVPNAVQLALASQRHLGVFGTVVHKNAHNEIDMGRAAKTFIDIKAKLARVTHPPTSEGPEDVDESHDEAPHT